MMQTFEIVEGVRRAKAFELAGLSTIRAVVQNQDGTLGPEMEVPLDSLRSPHKSSIDMSTTIQANRFGGFGKPFSGAKVGRFLQLSSLPAQKAFR